MLSDKLWAIIGATLLALLAADTFWIIHQKDQLALARADQQAKQLVIDKQAEAFKALSIVVQANEVAINARDKALADLKKARTDSQLSMKKAAEKNPEWSKQIVPVEILENIE